MNLKFPAIYKLPILLCLLISIQLSAQAPAGYYDGAKGKSAKTLLIALHNIIDGHKNVGYDGLWEVYAKSDLRPDGTIWDMYSTSKYVLGKGACGNYKYVGDCYNREHSFPKSWFSKGSPMVSDAYHIYPTDGKVNGQRSNYSYGETDNGTTLPSNGGVDALGKLGSCTFPGCSGTVFEPVDEYKGDFARTYFYMAARYQDKIRSWGGGMTAGNDYPCYKDWVINMLLKWHRQDPVSQKEVDRNNAVYGFQHNRNPFIDYPELAEYVWGDSKDTGWTPGGVVKPILISPVEGQQVDMGITAVGRELSYTIEVKGQGLTENLNVSVVGTGFTAAVSSLDKDAVINGTTLKLTYTPLAVAKDNATLKLSNKDLTVTVFLIAEAVDGIPAQQATNIGLGSFTAGWTNVDGVDARYHLTVWDTDKNAPVYSEDVPASSGRQEITGLEMETEYHYQLSYNGRVSNIIDVKTLAPVPVLGLTLPEEGLVFSTVPGAASEVKEVGVYTEYITEDVIAKVDAPFEISSDKAQWAQTLTLAAEGESFYIRLSASASAGTHVGTLSLETSTVDGDEADVRGTASLPIVFLEDFEGAKSGTDYHSASADVPCNYVWTMQNVGVMARSGDKYNGKQSVCMRYKQNASFLTLKNKKDGGCSTLSFYAALYNSDPEATIEISYLMDGLKDWKPLGTRVIANTVLQQFTYTVNIAEPLQIRFRQLSGNRINIDDIAMTDYAPTSLNQTKDRTWDAYAQQGKLVLEMDADRLVKVFSANAATMYQQEVAEGITRITLPQGMYIVVSGDHAKKVIIK